MSAASIALDSQLPEEYAIEDPKTSSTFVLRKSYVEILPTEQIEFQSNSGQDTIKFTIASNSDFWISNESYLKFTFQNYSEAGVEAVTPYDNHQSLSSIGAHCLFRQIEFKAVSSGTQLAISQFYNHQVGCQQLYMTESEAQHTPAGLDKNLWETVPIRNVADWFAFDGSVAAVKQARWDFSSQSLHFSGPSTDALDDEGGRTLNPIGIVNIGDIIFCVDQSRSALVELKQDAGTFAPTALAVSEALETLHIGMIKGYSNQSIDYMTYAVEWFLNGPTNDQLFDKIVVHRRRITIPFSRRVCDGLDHTIVMPIKNSMFWYTWPLFLFKGGIECILYLERGNVAMVDNRVPYAIPATDMTYKIKFPRLVVRLSTPEPSVQRDLINKWNSDMGLIYYTPQVASKRINGNRDNGDMYLNLQFGKRSMRSLLWHISPSIVYGDDALAKAHDSFRAAIHNHVKWYQVQISSSFFPQQRMVTDHEGVEPYIQSRMCGVYNLVDVDGPNLNIYERGWIRYPLESADAYYWVSATGRHVSLAVGAADESQHKATKLMETRERVYCVDFSRSTGKTGILTGVDGSMASVDLVILRNGLVFSDFYATTSDSRRDPLNGTAINGYVGQWSSGTTPVYWAHCLHDQFIRLSSQGISVLN